MELESILLITTVIMSFILGKLAKRVKFVNYNIIPLQNLIIGIIAAAIYYAYTKDFNLAIASIGLSCGGTHAIIKDIKNTNAQKEAEDKKDANTPCNLQNESAKQNSENVNNSNDENG